MRQLPEADNTDIYIFILDALTESPKLMTDVYADTRKKFGTYKFNRLYVSAMIKSGYIVKYKNGSSRQDSYSLTMTSDGVSLMQMLKKLRLMET